LSGVAELVTAVWDLLVAAGFMPPYWRGSCWSARSRVAARTNELDADERWLIIGSEE
jgi:hypothetical protein